MNIPMVLVADARGKLELKIYSLDFDKQTTAMSTLRLKYFELSKDALSGFLQTQKALNESPLEKKLIQLVYQRVSLINGCAYCLAKHAKELRAAGESDERIDALPGWRVSDLYAPRERAALAWADALTHIDKSGASDEDFEALKTHFDSRGITDLTFAIALMNSLNRVAISMRQ
jgi:AhpD family alkylhydroperoxidase